jgi:hypothetical protein
MTINIKRHLLQEGIIQGVKENFGKIMLGAGGVALANAGVFGDKAKENVQAGGARLNEFTKDAQDWMKGAGNKLNEKYGTDTDGDGKSSIMEAMKDNITSGAAKVADGTKNLINDTKDKMNDKEPSSIEEIISKQKDSSPTDFLKNNDGGGWMSDMMKNMDIG